MDAPEKKKGWPWWVWLVVILFPIPFGIDNRRVTAGFIAAFAVLVGAIAIYYKNK